jgi:hypothetical protein
MTKDCTSGAAISSSICLVIIYLIVPITAGFTGWYHTTDRKFDVGPFVYLVRSKTRFPCALMTVAQLSATCLLVCDH